MFKLSVSGPNSNFPVSSNDVSTYPPIQGSTYPMAGITSLRPNPQTRSTFWDTDATGVRRNLNIGQEQSPMKTPDMPQLPKEGQDQTFDDVAALSGMHSKAEAREYPLYRKWLQNPERKAQQRWFDAAGPEQELEERLHDARRDRNWGPDKESDSKDFFFRPSSLRPQTVDPRGFLKRAFDQGRLHALEKLAISPDLAKTVLLKRGLGEMLEGALSDVPGKSTDQILEGLKKYPRTIRRAGIEAWKFIHKYKPQFDINYLSGKDAFKFPGSQPLLQQMANKRFG